MPRALTHPHNRALRLTRRARQARVQPLKKPLRTDSKGAKPMKSAERFFLLVFVAVALSASAWAQGRDYSKIEITAEKITPNLYMLSGSAGADPSHQDAAGGRIGLLAGPDGIFMVDAQYEPLTDKGLAARS